MYISIFFCLYSSVQLAKKYLGYYITASNGKGHGVHSPFVFDFITHVLNDRKEYPCYQTIEAARKILLQDKSMIMVQDHGAGSAVIREQNRKVSAIAASSLKPAKYAQLLFRMVQYYQPKKIVELGTSFGLTTAYLASGNPSGEVVTLEGSEAIAKMAMAQFNLVGLTNIRLFEGPFSATLPVVLKDIASADFVFIDGNHRYQPTMDYFDMFRNASHQKTILVFDDIHWSREMEDAWNDIKSHPSVTLSIDLFFIGIVFFDPSFLAKQQFSIRF